jgi:hypothetical protein
MLSGESFMGSQLRTVVGRVGMIQCPPMSKTNKEINSKCADACQIIQESIEAVGLIAIQHMTISK